MYTLIFLEYLIASSIDKSVILYNLLRYIDLRLYRIFVTNIIKNYIDENFYLYILFI